MAIRLDRVTTLCFGVPFRVFFPQPDQGCISILMYHRISDASEGNISPYFRVNTSPARFEQQMRFLSESDYKVIDLTHAVELLKRNAFTRNHVVITFDDGFSDFYTAAFPILAKYRFPATVFLPTGCIGQIRKQFKNADCLTWNEVKELSQARISFGSHTVNHPKLKELSYAEIRNELRDSRTTLEQNLQGPINTFAYPYAFPETNKSFVSTLTQILQETGYICCVTTIIGNASASDSAFALKRIPMNDCDDLTLFAAKLNGAYDWLALPQRIRKHTRREVRQEAVLAQAH